VISDIFEVIVVSMIAGVAITASYSFVVLGSGRSAEARRAGNTGAALAFGALAVFFLIVFFGGFVLAVVTMLNK
jgi:hypothetical protein